MASETIEDILAEMRTKAKHFEEASALMVSESALALFLYPIIDRIEAAAKREAAIHAMTCEANERLREHLGIAIENNKRTPGNAAAMREAVDYLCERLAELDATFDPFEVDCLRAALSAPPRNCDRFCTASEAKEEFITIKELPEGSGDREMREWFRCCLEWLYAPETERKGESDGR